MAIHVMRSIGFNYRLMGVGSENSVMLFFKTKYLNISFQLLFKAGVQALPKAPTFGTCFASGACTPKTRKL